MPLAPDSPPAVRRQTAPATWSSWRGRTPSASWRRSVSKGPAPTVWGLASFVRRHAIRVVEVSHRDRRKRRNNGKSDTIDAETAARSVLSGIATAIPKTTDGAAEMVRQIKIARDTVVKARSAAIITLKSLIVNASDALRESLDPLTDKKLIDRCAALVPGNILAPTACG